MKNERKKVKCKILNAITVLLLSAVITAGAIMPVEVNASEEEKVFIEYNGGGNIMICQSLNQQMMLLPIPKSLTARV